MGLGQFQRFLSCDPGESGSVSRSVVSDSVQPIDGSPPGSSVHRILQARILEWVAISFSKMIQSYLEGKTSGNENILMQSRSKKVVFEIILF